MHPKGAGRLGVARRRVEAAVVSHFVKTNRLTVAGRYVHMWPALDNNTNNEKIHSLIAVVVVVAVQFPISNV